MESNFTKHRSLKDFPTKFVSTQVEAEMTRLNCNLVSRFFTSEKKMLDPIILASKQPRMRKLTAEEYYVRSGIDEKSKISMSRVRAI